MNFSLNLLNERTPSRLVMPTTIGPSNHSKPIDKDKRDENKDSITLSPQAHNMFSKNRLEKPMFERLMEYKQHILDKRNDYVSGALERGASPDEIKTGLDEIDEQIQNIDKQIQLLQQEELRKATGSDDKNLKEDDGDADKTVTNNDSSDSQDSSAMQATADTMKAVISTSTEVKQAKHVKMAQLTLESEALNWASNPTRSARLQKKADELDGKMIHTSQNAVANMKHSIENSHEDTKPQSPVNKDEDVATPVAGIGDEAATQEGQKEEL